MNRRRPHRFEAHQGHLFHPRRVRPSWEALSTEIRTEVTELVAQILSAYQQRHAASGATGKEARDE